MSACPCRPPLPDQYIEGRAALGAPEVNRRFVEASIYSVLPIANGICADDILTPDGVTGLTGVPSREVVRTEAVAERVGRSVAAGHGELM
jgi:hypothetical protein